LDLSVEKFSKTETLGFLCIWGKYLDALMFEEEGRKEANKVKIGIDRFNRNVGHYPVWFIYHGDNKQSHTQGTRVKSDSAPSDVSLFFTWWINHHLRANS